MVMVVVFEFSGMRCQPLRRALGCLIFNTLVVAKLLLSIMFVIIFLIKRLL
ncbi:acetyltransferase [Vibrio cholerae]|nr:acetyltransferase [Vibrio cholerae]